MMEFISVFWANNKGSILDILLIVVGLSAFGVYFWQKRDKKRSAATLIIDQIDSIEVRVSTLKSERQLGNIAVYHSKKFIGENAWERYKHLYVKELSLSEYRIIQDFFDNAEQLERARVDIIKTITNAWADKSSVEHELIGNMISVGATSEEIEKKIGELNKKINIFKKIFDPMDLVFTPDIAITALTANLNNFHMLSGTTAYEKIRKYSFSK